MPRLMYDSTSPFDIPKGAQMVAGYTDGAYAWSSDGWLYHSGATFVRICAVSIDMSAQVADIENGALTVADGVEFVRQKLARGEWPSLYFSTSLLGSVQAALAAAGFDPYHSYQYWAAEWDGVYAQWDGAVAHQYANPALSGGHYDLSWVADYWPGVDVAAPIPAPAPIPTPSPTPAPTPVPVANLDTARVSWANLGDLWTNAAPQTVTHLGAAVTAIRGL